MRIINRSLFSALVLASLFGAAGRAGAATITAQSGDLIMAFEVADQSGVATGGQENLEIDLGSLASLDALAGGIGHSVTLGNFLSPSDLTSTYGSSWASPTDTIDWTVFGTNTTTDEIWTTDTHAASNDTAGNLQGTSGAMSSIYSDLNGVTSTANSNYAYVTSSQSDSNSFTQDIGQGVNNWGSSDIPSSVLDPTTSRTAFALYDLMPTGSGVAPKVGTFTLSNTGVLTFTEVPEPSTWASLICGAGFLLAYRRRTFPRSI